MKMVTENILDISHNYCEYLMNLENVNGVGLGYKCINGINTKEPCVHVLVKDKINSKYLTKDNIIPNNYMGIKTDVIEVGNITTNNGNDSEKIPEKFRPLEGGCSISPYNYPEGEGTLGCIVTKIVKGEKNFYILSNNHVLALNNRIAIGTPVVQPSEELGGEYKDSIATLSNYIRAQFISYRGKPVNLVDCAIAKLNDQSLASNRIYKIGKIMGTNKPQLDLDIKKTGFVSGLTEGKIITMGLSIIIKDDYDPSGLNSIFYQDQIMGNIFSTGGDSGSVALNSKNQVVGLLFAGNDKAGTSLFNDINVVMEKLKIDIYTE